jgi:hypothetical protein
MTDHFRKAVLTVLFSAAAVVTLQAQNTQVTAKLDRATVRIGEQVKLHLTVFQRKGEKVIFPVLTDTLTANVQVLGSGKTDTINNQQDAQKIAVTKSYMITSFDAGAYQLPPLAFVTALRDTSYTDPLSFNVESVKVDTTKSIYDIKQPLAVSYTWIDWLKDNWYWILVPFLAGLGIGVTIWYLLKRRKQQPVLVTAKADLPLDVIALNKLRELKDKKLWQQGEVKAYYSEMTDVIREYLEKRYQIKTQEKTTEEIFEGLRQANITAENKNKLYSLLSNADLVKFAKGNPDAAENESSMEEAVELVIKTRTAERKEGGSGVEHV